MQYSQPSQGILGSLLIKLNVKIAIYRRNSLISEWPILEVVCVSAITAAVSYLVCSSVLPPNGYAERLARLSLHGGHHDKVPEARCSRIYRVQSSELVANLFQECDPSKGDYHGLCK